MSVKAFISYCHKDENFREELETHLALMKRNNEIESWSDRKIVPGQEWGAEIDHNIETASIIFLLISSDFIASNYCFDIEVKTAIERHKAGNAIVIPIILRPCDWKTAPFSKIQALPQDVTPITKWADRDEAWLNVVDGIRKAISTLRLKKSIVPKSSWSKRLNPEFKAWLDDTEVQLSHRKVNKILLSDIYVPPDLKILNTNPAEVSISIESESLVKEDDCFLIVSDEQLGKTSLSKFYFSEFLKIGYTPILLNGKEIKKSNLTENIEKCFQEQYESVSISNFNDCANKVLIIDDFSDITINKKYTGNLVSGAIKDFEKCIFFAADSYQYAAPEISELDSFKFAEILPFGNLKRAELIKKWVSLGVEEQITDSDLYAQCDDIRMRIDSMVRRNIVPAKPIYLLTLLQMFEAYTTQRLELTSYGHCYQYLVYQALERAHIKQSEIDKYLNVLTEFAWFQYKNDGLHLSASKLNDFFVEYEKLYLKVDRNTILTTLLNSSVLCKKSDKVGFKYSYIYYFFAAKKIADCFYSCEHMKTEIKLLLSSLHRENSANIIIFITHHTKDNWILNEIIRTLSELFDDQSEASLDSNSLTFLHDFIKSIPELVIEHREIENERKEALKTLDAIESDEALIEENSNNLEPADILAKINQSFKAIEIVGQIVRNRHASLNKETLIDIVDNATSTGLRFLQYFIGISDVCKDEVIKTITHILQENPTTDNRNIEKEAKNMFLFLTYGVIFGVLKKISSSIGSKEAEEIYRSIEAKKRTPAIKLINQAITLQFHKHLEFGSLDTLIKEFNNNPTCMRILKEIVVQHTYMFPVDYKDKQRISESLQLTMQGQRLMDRQQSFKM